MMSLEIYSMLGAVVKHDEQSSAALEAALCDLILKEGPVRNQNDREADAQHVMRLLEAKIDAKKRQVSAFRRAIMRLRLEVPHGLPSGALLLKG